jgi:predicted nucleotidyltransferase
MAAATARDRLLIAAYRGEAMDRPGDQLAALVDLTRALTDRGIAHALIGGIAVGIRSEVPRATDDVDIAVSTSVTREEAVAALTQVGFMVTGEFAHSVNLRHVSGEPVQVAFDPFFDEMIARAEEVEVAGAVVRVLTKEDLIRTKERAAHDPAGRKSKALRDQADIELLRGDVPGPDEGW